MDVLGEEDELVVFVVVVVVVVAFEHIHFLEPIQFHKQYNRLDP